MTNLIIRLFIRNYREVESPSVRSSYGRVAGLVGIATNLLLACAKLLAGILFHSIAIIADAVNNFSDSASSVVTMVGFKMAAKPADKEHPYGHARMEYIAGLIVSVIILLLGVELGRSSVEKVITPEPAETSILIYIVLGGSVLAKLWQCFFYRKMGKIIGSSTLKATSADSRNDVIATSVVLIGAVITQLTGFNLDGYLGIAVALFIIFSGIQLIRETTDPLLGAAPSAKTVEALRNILDECDEILGYHDLQLHEYGAHNHFATVHFEMDSKMHLQESHEIIDRMERRVEEELGIHLVVHLDPIAVDDAEADDLRIQTALAVCEISPELHLHDFQVQWGDPTLLSFDLAAPFGFEIPDAELRSMVEEKLQQLGNFQLRIVLDHHDVALCEKNE